MDIKFEDIVDRLVNGEHDFNIASELSEFLNNAVKEANAREAARKQKEEEERVMREAAEERKRSLRDHAEYFAMGIMGFFEEFCDDADFRDYVENKEEDLIDSIEKVLDEFSMVLPLAIKLVAMESKDPKVEKNADKGSCDRAIGCKPQESKVLNVPIKFNINPDMMKNRIDKVTSSTPTEAKTIEELSDDELDNAIKALLKTMKL